MRHIKNKIIAISCISLLSGTANAFAQDDLLKLAETAGSTQTEEVTSTFKTSKIVNAHTTELLKKRNLDFRVGHRFGNIGKESGGGFHTFYGLDNAADIRIAFEYGVFDDLTVALSRSKRDENMEGFIKYRILTQTVKKMPVSVALFASTVMTFLTNNNSVYDNSLHRFTYTYQAIIARKFSPSLSLVLLPTFIHRNYVFDPKDENNLYSIGFGGRMKLTKRSAIIADYFLMDDRKGVSPTYHMPLGIGWEVETGGHVFSLMFTNSGGLIEPEFIGKTTDMWTKGGFKFGFNISRVFQL